MCEETVVQNIDIYTVLYTYFRARDMAEDRSINDVSSANKKRSISTLALPWLFFPSRNRPGSFLSYTLSVAPAG